MTRTMDMGITIIRGHTFDFSDPFGCELRIEDLAAPLANTCRFTGQVPIGRWYSVAQHCVNASLIVAPEHAYNALMHDTAEAFTGDITRPYKEALPAIKELERTIESAMGERFGFTYPLSPEVHLADNQMLALEMKFVCGWDPEEYEHLRGIGWLELAPKVDLHGWPPAHAYNQFLRRYRGLRGVDAPGPGSY